jgi:hypothetical protein
MKQLIVISKILTQKRVVSMIMGQQQPNMTYKHYYKGEGEWTTEPWQAKSFESASEAVKEISTFTEQGAYQYEILYII